jgi:hypothetical protein
MLPLIDPMDALAAVNKAVKMVKMAASTTDNVASLGPLLGNYFEAKHQAVQSARAAKKKGGSNLGAAVQIEMAIKAQKDFEIQLKGLFFSSNNMDVWNSIMQRVAEMDAADRVESEREKAQAARRKRQQQEFRELAIGIVIAVVIVSSGGYLLVKILTSV